MAELAGVLLAVPPLMISWLEHYRECFEVYHNLTNFSAEHRKCKTQVQMVQLDIDLLLAKLLLPVVDSEQELEELKCDQTALQDKLKHRLLGNVSITYKDALGDLYRCVNELESTLGLHDQQLQELIAKQKGVQVTASRTTLLDRGRRRAQYEVLRAKFSISQKPRDTAFANIRHQLDAMNKILTSNDEVVELKASMRQRQTSKDKPLLVFWRHAKRLHQLIVDSWLCHCKQQHLADLQLVQKPPSKVKVDIEFIYGGDQSQAKTWTRVSACVSCVELSSRPRKVAFAGEQSASTEEEALTAINDMCVALHNVQLIPFNGLLQADNTQYKLALESLHDKYGLKHKDMLSLHTLLEHNKLSRRQRYELAITIASSHVQLHHSKWLSGGWSAHDVLFKTSCGMPDVEHPFLRHKFDSSERSDMAFELLGILLLELCFGVVLEKCRYAMSDRTATAWAWLEDVEGDTGEQYAHATEWCLGKKRVREDSNWREDFNANVLGNLRRVAEAQWPS